jgi:hypothetical protein
MHFRRISYGLICETGVLILSHMVKCLSNPDLGLQNICIHIRKTNFIAEQIYNATAEQEVYLC